MKYQELTFSLTAGATVSHTGDGVSTAQLKVMEEGNVTLAEYNTTNRRFV